MSKKMPTDHAVNLRSLAAYHRALAYEKRGDPEAAEQHHQHALDLEAAADELTMTLRDRFAAAALTGMHANAEWNNASDNNMAAQAYDQAEAMLRARAQ
jgi:hypothetical protein